MDDLLKPTQIHLKKDLPSAKTDQLYVTANPFFRVEMLRNVNGMFMVLICSLIYVVLKNILNLNLYFKYMQIIFYTCNLLLCWKLKMNLQLSYNFQM